jgi:signal peptidase I
MSEIASETHVPWWRVRVSPARQAAGVVLLLLAASFFYVMLGRGMRFYAVSSISMEPTFHDGDRIVAFPAEHYQRGDLVVLRDPVDNHGHIVKRVIALPGDTVEVIGGALRLNGVYVSEPYRPEPIDYVLPPYVVPEETVFVLGDNANWSVDSHNWAAAFKDAQVVVPGAVPSGFVQGRVSYRYLPFGRIGPIASYPIDRMVGS